MPSRFFGCRKSALRPSWQGHCRGAATPPSGSGRGAGGGGKGEARNQFPEMGLRAATRAGLLSGRTRCPDRQSWPGGQLPLLQRHDLLEPEPSPARPECWLTHSTSEGMEESDCSRLSGAFPANESERPRRRLDLFQTFLACPRARVMPRHNTNPPFFMQAAAPAGMEIHAERKLAVSCDYAGYPPKAAVAPAALRQAQVAAQASRCWQFP